jgi:hypothetical protein
MNQFDLGHLNDDAAIKPFNAPQEEEEEVRRTSISVTCSVMYCQRRAWRFGSTVPPLSFSRRSKLSPKRKARADDKGSSPKPIIR